MAMISVIVPIYNGEKYLADCIDSILCQSCPDFELLLVDDGSADRTPDICDAYAAKDSRVKVIHQKNSGVSYARNRGLEAAAGTYIAFVDADDIVHPQYLEILLDGMNRNGTKLSLCTFQYFNDETPADFSAVSQAAFSRLSQKELLSLLNEWANVEALSAVVPCVKLYRAELFHNVRFPEGIRHEDEFVAHRILAQCEEAAFCTLPLYGYRQNPDSYMNQSDGPIDFSHLSLVDALVERIELYEHIAPELVSGAVHHLLRECNSYFNLYGGKNRYSCKKQRKWLVATYRKAYHRYFAQLDMQERVKGGLFASCPEGYRLLAKGKQNREGA